MINLNLQYKPYSTRNYTPKPISQKPLLGNFACQRDSVSFKGLSPKGIKFDLSNIFKSVKSETLDAEEVLTNFKSMPFLKAEEYKKLPAEVKRIISEAAPDPSISAANDTVPWSIGLRKYYNNTFGENKYSVVSIGHSPEPIVRGLEHLGVPAKYLPLSDVRKCKSSKEFNKTITASNNYLRYMDRIGLFDFEKPKTIFLDYTDSGKTLRYLKKFFLDEIEAPAENMEFRSLNTDMKKVQRLYNKRTDLGIPDVQNALSQQTMFGYIFYYLINSKAERFQNIPSLPFREADTIFEKMSKDNSNSFGKFFNFKVLEILDKLNLLPKK